MNTASTNIAAPRLSFEQWKQIHADLLLGLWAIARHSDRHDVTSFDEFQRKMYRDTRHFQDDDN